MNSQPETSFKTRLQEEGSSLSVKIEKLELFMRSPKYLELDPRDRYLLMKQMSYMSKYLGILELRLMRLGEVPEW